MACKPQIRAQPSPPRPSSRGARRSATRRRNESTRQLELGQKRDAAGSNACKGAGVKMDGRGGDKKFLGRRERANRTRLFTP